MTEDHVVDLVGRDRRTLQQTSESRDAEVDRGQALERSPVSADRGAHRLTDDCLTHLLFRLSRVALPRAGARAAGLGDHAVVALRAQ